MASTKASKKKAVKKSVARPSQGLSAKTKALAKTKAANSTEAIVITRELEAKLQRAILTALTQVHSPIRKAIVEAIREELKNDADIAPFGRGITAIHVTPYAGLPGGGLHEKKYNQWLGKIPVAGAEVHLHGAKTLGNPVAVRLPGVSPGIMPLIHYLGPGGGK